MDPIDELTLKIANLQAVVPAFDQHKANVEAERIAMRRERGDIDGVLFEKLHQARLSARAVRDKIAACEGQLKIETKNAVAASKRQRAIIVSGGRESEALAVLAVHSENAAERDARIARCLAALEAARAEEAL